MSFAEAWGFLGSFFAQGSLADMPQAEHGIGESVFEMGKGGWESSSLVGVLGKGERGRGVLGKGERGRCSHGEFAEEALLCRMVPVQQAPA